MSDEFDGWWYGSNDKRYGPVDEDTLRQLHAAGIVTPDTLFWREGQTDWLRRESIPELARILPPPLPTVRHEVTHEVPADSQVQRPPATTSAVTDAPTPVAISEPASWDALVTNQRAWLRFFARFIDLTVLSYALSYPLFWLFGRIAAITLGPDGARSVIVPVVTAVSNPLVASIIAILLGTIGEGLLLGLFGQTLGRAIAGIRVRLPSGAKLGMSQALKRSFAVWVRGLGLGLPIVWLVTANESRKELVKFGLTIWDRGKYQVLYRRHVGGFRFALVALSWLVIYVGGIALSIEDSTTLNNYLRSNTSPGTQTQRDNAPPTPPIAKADVWTNPVTKLPASMPVGWKAPSKVQERDGQTVYQFDHASGRAALLLVHETLPQDVDFETYAAALFTANPTWKTELKNQRIDPKAQELRGTLTDTINGVDGQFLIRAWLSSGHDAWRLVLITQSSDKLAAEETLAGMASAVIAATTQQK